MHFKADDLFKDVVVIKENEHSIKTEVVPSDLKEELYRTKSYEEQYGVEDND